MPRGLNLGRISGMWAREFLIRLNHYQWERLGWSAKKRQTLVVVSFSIIALFRISVGEALPLRVHPKNPRYFMNSAGEALYVTGSATWYILHENGHPVNERRIQAFLDWLQHWGHNYTRVWSGSFYLKNNKGPQKPWPYGRPGPYYAHDGMPRFDLTQPNKDYFNLLRTFLSEVDRRGMYCSIMLFGSFNGFRDDNKFRAYTAWYPDNNLNAETKILKTGTDFFAMEPGLVSLQEAHVRRMIDAFNGFDNFVWEIMNEAKLPDSKAWQFHMIDYIRNYENTKAKQHLIIMSGGYNESGTILESSPADIISPDKDPNGYRSGGPASYTDKIVINDTDHLWGFSNVQDVETYRKWVWKTFTRGNHPIFMDDYDLFINKNDGQVNPAYDPVRKNLGYTLTYAQRFIDLASMEPSESVSSTTYCLHNSGNEYLVYQPLSDSFTVYLIRGEYYLEWFDPNDESVSCDTIAVNDDGRLLFQKQPHVSDDAVLYLKRIE